MPDGAPSHSTGQTIVKLRAVGIVPVEWPPYFPDLNPIENIWNIVKNFLQYISPELDQRTKISIAKVRELSKITWDSIDSKELENLVDSIPRWCQQVLETRRGYIKC